MRRARVHRVRGTYGTQHVSFIGLSELARNKRATGRLQDTAMRWELTALVDYCCILSLEILSLEIPGDQWHEKISLHTVIGMARRV